MEASVKQVQKSQGGGNNTQGLKIMIPRSLYDIYMGFEVCCGNSRYHSYYQVLFMFDAIDVIV